MVTKSTIISICYTALYIQFLYITCKVQITKSKTNHSLIKEICKSYRNLYIYNDYIKIL